jgi:hypothetical protein
MRAVWRPTFQRSPRKGRNPLTRDPNRPDPEWPLNVDAGRSISRDEGCRRVELTGSKLLSGTVGRVQAFRTACGSFVTDSGPSRAAL